jgi:hypothetical protein
MGSAVPAAWNSNETFLCSIFARIVPSASALSSGLSRTTISAVKGSILFRSFSAVAAIMNGSRHCFSIALSFSWKSRSIFCGMSRTHSSGNGAGDDAGGGACGDADGAAVSAAETTPQSTTLRRTQNSAKRPMAEHLQDFITLPRTKD